MNTLARTFVTALLLLLPIVAGAQTYPNRAIRIIAPYPPGAGTDILSRAVGQGLTETWGQQVVVDNRPGASGMIGADIVAKAAPDGYTLLMGSVTEAAIVQGLHAKMTYDPVKDLAPVTMVAITPLVLVIHPSIPARSLQELIALARARPGQLTFGSAGNGSAHHLSGELLKTLARIDMVHVPYKGAAPAVADLLGGQISMSFLGLPAILPHAKAGKLRALAVSTAGRAPGAPHVPTMEEAGLPGFDISVWFGVYVPAGTPKDVIAKLNGEISKGLNRPDMKKRLENQGFEVVGNSAERFDAFFRAEIVKYARIIKDSGAKAD